MNTCPQLLRRNRSGRNIGFIRKPAVLLAGSAICAAAALNGCGSAPRQNESRIERPARISKAPAPAPRTIRGGGYYLDDGPGDSPPPNLDSVPDAVPQLEPLNRGAMKPYVVMGQTYTPMTELTPYKARGTASWYGRRYHGKQTSTGELYDMYSMSAAHPTLPLPSYVRVTNVANGKVVVVRVNDRGPFIDNRLIDLSYTAAYKLDVLSGGSALVEVETIIPDGTRPATMIARAPGTMRPFMTGNSQSAIVPQQAAAADPDPILAIAASAGDVGPSDAAAEPQNHVAARLAPPAKTSTVDAAGIYVQLAAFGSKENAESYLARARLQFDWLAQALHLFARDGMYRVHAGPYANSVEARQIAERIAVALGTKPVVVCDNANRRMRC